MTRFGTIPPEPPKQNALDVCAPKFGSAVLNLLHDMQDAGLDPYVFETLRTDEREKWLYGFSRDYDDGDGWRTNAQSALYSWHGYGLAADIISENAKWDAPARFWDALSGLATVHGLTWGGTWKEKDKPHVQWSTLGMHVSPSDHARQLIADAGMEAVWREVGAA